MRPRHRNVGDDQIEQLALLEQRQGLESAARLGHLVAGVFECLPLKLADSVLVVDDQDARVVGVRHHAGLSSSW